MASPSEQSSSPEIVPVEELYNNLCARLHPGANPNQPDVTWGGYEGDGHYWRASLAIADTAIQLSITVDVLVNDYFAGSTRNWRSEEYSVHEPWQAELLETKRTILNVSCTSSDPRYSHVSYFILRPSDIKPTSLLGETLFYGSKEWDIDPGVQPDTYDPDEVMAIVRKKDDYRKADPQDPLLLSLYKETRKN